MLSAQVTVALSKCKELPKVCRLIERFGMGFSIWQSQVA
jgi:hypothetical protein